MKAFSSRRLGRRLALVAVGVASYTCAEPSTSPSRLESDAPSTISPTNPHGVAQVTVKLVLPTTAVGGANFASARAWNASGQQLPSLSATWASTNPAIATINPTTGFVRGMSNGTSTLIATISGVTGQIQIVVGTGAPSPPAPVATQLAIVTQPVGGNSGSPLATQPIVELRDANNVVVTGASAAVTATIASGTGALGGTTTVSAVNGVAAF